MRVRALSIFLSALLLLSIFPLFAQESPWYVGKPIADIRFQGLTHVDESELEPIVEPFIGQSFSDNLFRDLQSKLYALNYFQRLKAEALPQTEAREQVVIRFTAEERPIVDEIIIRGNSNIRDSEILDKILLKQDDILTQNKINADETAISELYQEKGYPNVQVESRRELNEEENTATLYFSIEEGRQTKVQTIRFEGNSFASDNTLKGKLKTKEISLFQSGIFKENQIEQDKKAIEEYYHSRGFIDAAVEEVTREVAKEEDKRNLLTLTYYITEGSRWSFGGVTFDGNTLFSDETLREKITLDKGDTLDLTQLQKDFAKISDLYYNDGYIFNSINRTEQRNEEQNTISYAVTIVERGRAHIENILIKGNEKTKDRVLYREIPLETGDVFSKEKVIEGMRNLYNTGLFSSVSPETPVGSAQGLMDLVINVEEAKTTNINFGLTFTGQAGELPIVGFLKWTDNNFRGLGEKLSIGAELSGKKQNLNFSYNTDWLFGERWSAGVEFKFEHSLITDVQQDRDFPRYDDSDGSDSDNVPDPNDFPDEGSTVDPAFLMEYDQWEISLGLNTGYTFHTSLGRLGTHTGARTGLSYVDYDESLYRPDNSTTRENNKVWRFNNRWWTRLSWDTRDYIMAPSSGFYLTETFTYSGGILGGINNYLKSESKAEYFLTLFDVPVSESWSFKTVLALHSQLSLVFPQLYYDNGKWTTGVAADTTSLLYTDTFNTDRGFESYRQDGQAMFDNFIELRVPLSEQVIWADLFFRTTGHWDNRKDFDLSFEYDPGTESGYRFAFGGGVRFTIPNLPLGLYLSKGFTIQDGQVVWDRGELFRDPDDETSGLDLVLTINMDMMY
jgi:outer membrane protein insertion porin family